MSKRRTMKQCAYPISKIKERVWVKGRPFPNLPLGLTRIAATEDINELAGIIIQYAGTKGMTMSNIRESVRKVEKHMKNNAVLEAEDL